MKLKSLPADVYAAEILKDYSLGNKISASKEHSYVDQCQQSEKKAKER